MSKSNYQKHDVPDWFLSKWQLLVDLAADLLKVPAALIMRIHPDQIEVLVSSKGEDNPYRPHEMSDLGLGLYCEKVLATQTQLCVPNALADPEWNNNPDLELNMVSYFGLPLICPDDSLFGTICVLDRKPRKFARFGSLFWRIKSLIESDFVSIESLTASERRWHLLVNKANDAIFILDSNGRFREVNETLCLRLGYSADELLGMNVSEIDPPEFATGVPGRMDEVMRQSSAVFESAHVHRNGRIIPIELSCRAIELEGQPACLSIARDITERKQTERTLAFIAKQGWTGSGNDFLQSLVGFLSEVLHMEYVLVAEFLADGSGGIDAVKAFWACDHVAPDITPDQLGNADWLKVTGKEPSILARGARQEFPQDGLLLNLGADSYAAIQLWDSGGEPIGLIAALAKTPLDRPGIVARILQIVATRAAHELERQRYDADILQRQEHLEQLVKERTAELENTVSLLSATLESTVDGILAIDISGKTVTAFNRKFQQMFQIPGELLKDGDNARLIEYVINELTDPDKFITSIRDLYSNPEKTTFVELRFKDGRIFESSFQPQNSENKCVGRVWSFRDITTQRHAEENLQRYAEDLESFNKCMVDREMRIIEMKEEVNALCRELGREIKYPEIWKEDYEQKSERK